MTRALLLVGPVLMLVSYAAVAADPAGIGVVPAPAPDLSYLMTLGPYGALVWGAYLLGRGLKINIGVELSDTDRTLLRDVLAALGGRGVNPPEKR